LNQFRLGGFKLVFGVASKAQSSLLLILILSMLVRMNKKLDKGIDVNED